MIETKILGDAVGVQRGDVIDNSETTVLPSLANGVITGHFKRGRMDKPFKVTSSNYRSLLGYDPSNPSYLAVEDAFKRGVSELSILRVGGMDGGIKCIASFAEITGIAFGESVGKFLTVSRNGGEFVTLNLSSLGSVWPEVERITMYGQDGKSLAFLDHSYSLSGHPNIGQNCYWSWCGIDSSGSVTTPEGTFDLKNEEIETYDTSLPPHKVRPEHNWLVFKPTPDVEPSLDIYYRIAGSDTKETIEVHGCAVIDFNPPIIIPNACTPTALDILYTTGEGVQPTGDLYGRYRVNGGAWVNYTAPADYYLVRDFLEHTVVIRQLGGGSDSAFAFEAKRWGGYINGASAQAPYANMQNGILSIEQTTVDFQITDGGANDLVQLLFGGNASVSSCALGRWMGV